MKNFTPVAQSVDFKLPGFDFKQLSSYVVLNGRKIRPVWDEHASAFVAEEPAGKFVFKYTVENQRLAVDFEAELKQPADSLEVVFLDIPELRADHLLTQGVTMGRCESVSLPAENPRKVTGFYQTILRTEENYLCIETPMKAEFPITFEAEAKDQLQNLKVTTLLEFLNLTAVKLGPVIVAAAKNSASAWQNYADANAKPEADFEKARAVGWNSWDYYRWTISEKAVLENAEFIARDPVLGKKIKRIIIDDGWQYCYGEWEANHHFPSGMKSLAAELRKLNFTPGLWFAPALAEPHSVIAQFKTGMLAQGVSGLPCLGFECMRRNAMLLDPTVKEVEVFLYDLFRRYSEWGYGYFKLDFLRAVLNAVKFHDRSLGPGEIIRRLLTPIRNATLDRAVLLGCNYPFFAGTDLVDAVRIGSDICARWHGIKHNSISVAARYWMNHKLYLCDPDFSLCRSPETSDDPDLNRLRPLYVFVNPRDNLEPWQTQEQVMEVGRKELEVLLSVVLLSAGAINFSDRMTRLTPAGLELAHKLVEAPTGESGIPLDLMDHEYAGVWLQKVENFHRVLLVNWDDEPKVMSFTPAQYHVSGRKFSDFWAGKKLPYSSTLEFELPGRSCRLIEIR